MTNLEAKQHLARKLDIDYADIANNGLFSETDLQVLIQLGVVKAWDYRPWDFSEHKVTGTTSGATIAYDQNLMSGSIFLLRINSKEYKKLLFQDYLKYLEDNPSAADRLWSEFNRTIYVNTNAFTNGQGYEVYGRKMAPILSASGDLLPFSPDADNYEHSGNEAIVQLAYAEALDSEKKKESAKAETERKKAYQTLEILWKPFAEQRALLQSKGRPMLNVPDFFGNGNSSQLIGNFDYLN
jgi:hypothetical protein